MWYTHKGCVAALHAANTHLSEPLEVQRQILRVKINVCLMSGCQFNYLIL